MMKKQVKTWLLSKNEIQNNWGITGDAAENLELLGRKLAAFRDPTIPYWKSGMV